MSNVPNTEYITVNKNGVFVGGKPATKYRGQDIYDIDYVQETFAWMQKQNPKITEFHIISSVTPGGYAKIGNPLLNHGRHVWCRCVWGDTGASSSWVFLYTFSSAAGCAPYCAGYCARFVRNNAGFRAAVLGSAIDKGNTKNDNAQSVSKKPKTPKKPLVINLLWHIITIEKRKRTM